MQNLLLLIRELGFHYSYKTTNCVVPCVFLLLLFRILFYFLTGTWESIIYCHSFSKSDGPHFLLKIYFITGLPIIESGPSIPKGPFLNPFRFLLPSITSCAKDASPFRRKNGKVPTHVPFRHPYLQKIQSFPDFVGV